MLSRSLRFAHAWLLGLLPAAGAVVGIVYSRFGRTVEGGNDLIVDEIHKPGGGIPLRMEPLVLVGTLVMHLFFVRAALRNTLAMLFGLPNALILPTRLVEAGQESSIIGLQRLRQELIHQQRVHKWRSAFIRQLRRLFSPGFCPSNDKIHELRASEESFPEIMPLAPGDNDCHHVFRSGVFISLGKR